MKLLMNITMAKVPEITITLDRKIFIGSPEMSAERKGTDTIKIKAIKVIITAR